MSIVDIGEDERGSLLCMTNNTDCCVNKGEWYYPNNMSTVRTREEGDSFYSDGGLSVVRLHRRHNVTMPTGEFCCEVPDANEVDQMICIMVVPLKGIYTITN